MQDRITPRNGLVVVRPIEEKEQRTKSGIILPVTQGHRFEFCEIVAVGRGFPDAGKHVGTDDLQPGMLVLVKSGMSQELGHRVQTVLSLESDKKDGGRVFLCNQQDIFAVVRPQSAEELAAPATEPAGPRLVTE